ncbi:Zinc finger BED domain-containing protein 5 [Araneus ventricosus]|uniref:Zinc finger BED domain-containing protein 5 n=1 Tax=Araneus ventricosus TaxID=182803 RepID=A0A4Y2VP13_ARAVE|nr:Zinc finger BED domain-containing protein 5 [Araneus ventricosus]
MQSTSSSVQLQPHLPTRPSSNFGQVVSTKRRKYDTSYLSFGFTSTGNEEAPAAVCLLCNKILANSSLAPTKLLRHLEKNHPTDKGKDISFFIRKLESRSFIEKKFKTDNQKITEASYKVSCRIALAGEAHVIGESLIKPCVQDIVSCVLGQSYSKQFESVSLSNNTVKKRINDIADDIKLELISRLQACNAYALQLGESTDVAGLAILLGFVRYALVTKRISATFKSVLDEAVKIIKFIKSKPLQSRIFKAMCEDMGSLHTTLLLHTEVRWLSRGKMLVRIFELRMELMAYFIGHKFELSDRLNNMARLSTLTYHADTFGKLNELCLALQGKQVNILQAKDKLVAFSRKIQYWISAVEENNFECFQTLSDLLEESGFRYGNP